jgi:hypothetical protein
MIASATMVAAISLHSVYSLAGSRSTGCWRSRRAGADGWRRPAAVHDVIGLRSSDESGDKLERIQLQAFPDQVRQHVATWAKHEDETCASAARMAARCH